MGNPSPNRKAAAFISGIAAVCFILSAWACIRLSYFALTSNASTDLSDSAWIQLPTAISKVLLFIHLGLAAFSLYASYALYTLRPWSRLYFATALLAIAVEGSVVAVWMALQGPAPGEPAELKTIRWGVSAAVLLLSLCGILLAWKLYRDQGIKAAFAK